MDAAARPRCPRNGFKEAPPLLMFRSLLRTVSHAITRLLVWGTIQGIGFSVRKTWINWHVLEVMERRGEPYIMCVWHNNLLVFAHLLRGRSLGAMISRSKDGDQIAWILSHLGFVPVRGSSSTGGAMALRDMIRQLRKGNNVIFTPDGPRGPRYALQAGAVRLAAHTGHPIVPLCISAPRAWEAGSWDRMKLPKPFSRIAVMAGTPLYIAGDPDRLEAERLRVETALRRLVVQAEAFTGGTLADREPALAGAAHQTDE